MGAKKALEEEKRKHEQGKTKNQGSKNPLAYHRLEKWLSPQVDDRISQREPIWRILSRRLELECNEENLGKKSKWLVILYFLEDA